MAAWIILILFILFFIGYKIFVKVAKAITHSDFQQEVFTGDIKKEGTKFTFKIKDWFVWNVTVNNEKGTAGGNIKINFPIQFAALFCLAIAIVLIFFPLTFWLMPFIFASFAVFYFRKWFLSLHTISTVAKQAAAEIPKENVTHLTRASQNKIAGGVCRGLSTYFHFPVILIRLFFIGATLIPFISIPLYILLWYFLPKN